MSFRRAQARRNLKRFLTSLNDIAFQSGQAAVAAKYEQNIPNYHGRCADTDIVRVIFRLGKALGLRIIAEEVENKEQYHFLRAFGCQYFQGYFFARLMPVSEFVTKVKQKQTLSHNRR